MIDMPQEPLRHELKKAEVGSKWFSKAIRDYIRSHIKILREFEIYDNNENKYPARLDYDDRIFCPKWYNKFKPKVNDEIYVVVEGDKIIIYPFEETTGEFQISVDRIRSRQDNGHNGKNHLFNSKKQIIFYGPPGTGKTYNSRKRAVDIVIGDLSA